MATRFWQAFRTQGDIGKVNYFMGNLVVEELFDCVGRVKDKHGLERYPERIRINKKGLLVGEILNEANNNPIFRNKNFRKYKAGYCFLIGLIILASISLVTILFNQGLELKKKISGSSRQAHNIHTERKDFRHK